MIGGSSSYIYGPNGWCHPNGDIISAQNIGKYPTVEEIIKEWNIISSCFPFLDLTVTLASSPSNSSTETPILPIISFNISEGKISLCETSISYYPDSLLKNPYSCLYSKGKAVLNGKLELGLPKNWYREYAYRVKNALLELTSS